MPLATSSPITRAASWPRRRPSCCRSMKAASSVRAAALASRPNGSSWTSPGGADMLRGPSDTTGPPSSGALVIETADGQHPLGDRAVRGHQPQLDAGLLGPAARGREDADGQARAVVHLAEVD